MAGQPDPNRFANMYRGPGRSGGDYWRGWNNPQFGGRPHAYGFGNWMDGRQNPGIYGSSFNGMFDKRNQSPWLGGGLQAAGLRGLPGRNPGMDPRMIQKGLGAFGKIFGQGQFNQAFGPQAGYQNFLNELGARRQQAMGLPLTPPQGATHPSAQAAVPYGAVGAIGKSGGDAMGYLKSLMGV